MNVNCSIRMIFVVFLLEAIDLSLRTHKIHQTALSSTNDLLGCSLIQISQFFSLEIEVALYVLIEIRLEIAQNCALSLTGRVTWTVEGNGLSITRWLHIE